MGIFYSLYFSLLIGPEEKPHEIFKITKEFHNISPADQ